MCELYTGSGVTLGRLVLIPIYRYTRSICLRYGFRGRNISAWDLLGSWLHHGEYGNWILMVYDLNVGV